MQQRWNSHVERLRWLAINWKSWMLLAICLVLAILSGFALNFTAVRDRLPVILPTLAGCITVVCLFLSRFCTQRCLSCGWTPMTPLEGLAECPNCHRSYSGAVDLLAGKEAVSLQDCLTGEDSQPLTVLGLVLTLAIRDGANRVRVVGHSMNDKGEFRPTATCWAWSIWIRLADKDYEMLPPPRHLAAGVFHMLQETYLNAEKKMPNGPADLPLTLDDWFDVAQLVVEESEKQRVASIDFPPGPREPVSAAGSRLQEVYRQRHDKRDEGDGGSLPRSTTWKRTPGVVLKIPGRLLLGINLTAVILAIASYMVLVFMKGTNLQPLVVPVMSGSSLVLLVGAILLGIRRKCRCGTPLFHLSDENPPIWCPECRSVFDPSGKGLPMDGSTLRIDEFLRCRDPHVAWLAPLLDYVLDCGKDQVTFSGGDDTVAARLWKGDSDPVELREIDSWLALELMEEFDRRARKRGDGDAATFRMVGLLHEAVATLMLGTSEGKRTATLNLDYGATGRL